MQCWIGAMTPDPTDDIQEHASVEACVYCDEPVADVVEAATHHKNVHGSRPFNPLWYSRADDWDDADPADIPGDFPAAPDEEEANE